MPFRDLSKSIRRDIRELAKTAHERELNAQLHLLDARFSHWRSGRLDPHELNAAIHEFHAGPSRGLWKSYTASDPSFAVAGAIARGVLQHSEVPPGVAQELRPTIAALTELHDAELKSDDS